jgi:endonuclease/exonuclease/phosphatase family metal-dependent hydrolase
VTVRVVSWNVRSLRDSAVGVAAALRGLDADVVLLQEAPRLPGSPFVNARLARRAGLRRVTGGARAAGNLLLVSDRVAVHDARPVRFPRRPGLHRRGAVVGHLEVDGLQMTVLGSHLDLEPTARRDTARRLRALVPGADRLVIGADVNEQAGEPAWEALGHGLLDAGHDLGPTFPARAPRRRLDALLVGPRLVVVRAHVAATGAVSDHLPVVVDLAG